VDQSLIKKPENKMSPKLCGAPYVNDGCGVNVTPWLVKEVMSEDTNFDVASELLLIGFR
jgi:hypothetical protein